VDRLTSTEGISSHPKKSHSPSHTHLPTLLQQRTPIIKKAYDSKKLSTKAEVEKVVRAMIAAGAPPIRKHFPASAFHRMIQEGEHGFGYYPRIVRFFEEFFLYPKS
jgi:hypothetical protein